MEHVAKQMRRCGRTKWHLDVRCDNRPAIGLYESLGFKTTSKMVVFPANRTVLERLPEADLLIDIRWPRPEEDEERLAGLLPTFQEDKPSAVLKKPFNLPELRAAVASIQQNTTYAG